MAKFDEDNQSGNIEDRRGDTPMGDAEHYARNTAWNGTKMITKGVGMAKEALGVKPPRANRNSLEAQAGINSFEDGGVPGDDLENDTTPAMPTSQQQGGDPDQDAAQSDDTTGSLGATGATGPQQGPQQGPQLPAEEALDTRERGLDKSGLGGAFRQAQKQKITSERQKIVQAVLDHALKVYGMGGPSTAGQEGSDYQGPTNDAAAIPTSEEPDIGPLARGVRDLAQKAVTNIKAYGNIPALIRGDGAMPHDVAEINRSHNNPDRSRSPNDEAERAVEHAVNKGGVDTGLAFLQSSIQLFNASNGFSVSALDGKNLSSSLNAANKAFGSLPLEKDLNFTAGTDGKVTATTTDRGGTNPKAYSLTIPQYRDMSMRGGGLAYQMLAEGPDAVLSRLSQEDHEFAADPKSQGVKPGPNGPVPEHLADAGVNQATFNLGYMLFPWASQGAQRARFFASQAEGEQKHARAKEIETIKATSKEKIGAGHDTAKVTDEDIKQKGAVQVADIRKQGFEGRTAQRAQEAVLKIQQAALRAGDRDNIEKAKRLTSTLNDLIKNGSTVGEAEDALKKGGFDLSTIIGAAGQGKLNAPSVENPTGKGGATTSPTKAAPKVGEVRNGYKFLGGNPADKASWQAQ